MNIQRYLLSSFAGFVFIVMFDYIFHGNILMDAYERTDTLWRGETEMQDFMHWMFLNELLIAFFVGFIFTRHYESKGIPEGIRFGVMIGALISLVHFAMYAYMPIPIGLALAWVIGDIFLFTVVGVIFSLIYRAKE